MKGLNRLTVLEDLQEPGGLTGVEPALEGQAALLHVKGEVVDVEAAGRDHLDGLVVAHQPLVSHVDVRDVGRLSHVHAAGGEETSVRGDGALRSWSSDPQNMRLKRKTDSQLVDEDVRHPHVGCGHRHLFDFVKVFRIPDEEFIRPRLKRSKDENQT